MNPASFDLVDANEQTGIFYIVEGVTWRGPLLFVRKARAKGRVAVHLAGCLYSRHGETLHDEKTKCYREWSDAAEAVAHAWDGIAAHALDKSAAMRRAAKAARSAR